MLLVCTGTCSFNGLLLSYLIPCGFSTRLMMDTGKMMVRSYRGGIVLFKRMEV